MKNGEERPFESLLKGYPVVVEQDVVWGELDPNGHVNSVYYFRYVENSRTEYYSKIGKYQFVKETGINLLLASTSCRFKSSLKYPDRISIGASVSEIHKEKALMKYIVVNQTNNVVAAEGEAIIVPFDTVKGVKASFPEILKKRISKLEGKDF